MQSCSPAPVTRARDMGHNLSPRRDHCPALLHSDAWTLDPGTSELPASLDPALLCSLPPPRRHDSVLKDKRITLCKAPSCSPWFIAPRPPAQSKTPPVQTLGTPGLATDHSWACRGSRRVAARAAGSGSSTPVLQPGSRPSPGESPPTPPIGPWDGHLTHPLTELLPPFPTMLCVLLSLTGPGTPYPSPGTPVGGVPSPPAQPRPSLCRVLPSTQKQADLC